MRLELFADWPEMRFIYFARAIRDKWGIEGHSGWIINVQPYSYPFLTRFALRAGCSKAFPRRQQQVRLSHKMRGILRRINCIGDVNTPKTANIVPPVRLPAPQLYAQNMKQIRTLYYKYFRSSLIDKKVTRS